MNNKHMTSSEFLFRIAMILLPFTLIGIGYLFLEFYPILGWVILFIAVLSVILTFLALIGKIEEFKDEKSAPTKTKVELAQKLVNNNPVPIQLKIDNAPKVSQPINQNVSPQSQNTNPQNINPNNKKKKKRNRNRYNNYNPNNINNNKPKNPQ